MQEGPLNSRQNAIKSSVYLLQIGDWLCRRPTAAAPGTNHLEKLHRGTPPGEPNQQRSSCPTAMESGVRTELAVEIHRRKDPLSRARRRTLPRRDVTATTMAPEHTEERALQRQDSPRNLKQRTKTTMPFTSPSPPRPAGSEERTTPSARPPCPLATTAGRGRNLGFELCGRSRVLDPLLGVDCDSSASHLTLRPPEHHVAADQHRQSSYLDRRPEDSSGQVPKTMARAPEKLASLPYLLRRLTSASSDRHRRRRGL
jgi:hypothetical protein